MLSGMRLRRSLRSKSSNPRQLEILIVAVKFMKAKCSKNKELLIHSESFVDSWIKGTFIRILTAFVHG